MNFVDYINNNLSNYIIDNEWILLDVVIGKLINFIFEYLNLNFCCRGQCVNFENKNDGEGE